MPTAIESFSALIQTDFQQYSRPLRLEQHFDGPQFNSPTPQEAGVNYTYFWFTYTPAKEFYLQNETPETTTRSKLVMAPELIENNAWQQIDLTIQRKAAYQEVRITGSTKNGLCVDLEHHADNRHTTTDIMITDKSNNARKSFKLEQQEDTILVQNAVDNAEAEFVVTTIGSIMDIVEWMNTEGMNRAA